MITNNFGEARNLNNVIVMLDGILHRSANPQHYQQWVAYLANEKAKWEYDLAQSQNNPDLTSSDIDRKYIDYLKRIKTQLQSEMSKLNLYKGGIRI